MVELKFRARVHDHGRGTWGYVVVPRAESDKLGRRDRVPVQGTLNGIPVRSSLLPAGDGSFTMVVNAQVREAAGVRVGDGVSIRLEVDTAPRVALVPPDLRAALAQAPAARAYFAGLAYSHQRRYLDWVNSAGRPATRARRVTAAVARLTEREKLTH